MVELLCSVYWEQNGSEYTQPIALQDGVMGQFADGSHYEIISNIGILLENTDLVIRRRGLESQCCHFIFECLRQITAPFIDLSPVKCDIWPR